MKDISKLMANLNAADQALDTLTQAIADLDLLNPNRNPIHQKLTNELESNLRNNKALAALCGNTSDVLELKDDLARIRRDRTLLRQRNARLDKKIEKQEGLLKEQQATINRIHNAMKT